MTPEQLEKVKNLAKKYGFDDRFKLNGISLEFTDLATEDPLKTARLAMERQNHLAIALASMELRVQEMNNQQKATQEVKEELKQIDEKPYWDEKTGDLKGSKI